MNQRSNKLRIRSVIFSAFGLAVIVGAAVVIAVVRSRGDAESVPLRAVEGECGGLDVESYNSVMSDYFVAVPFMAFEDADRSAYGSDYATCETTPDLDNLCEIESEECSMVLHVAAEHDLWVSIDYDCEGFCGLTNEEATEIPEKEEIAGWDWSVPEFATRQLPGESGASDGTYQGQLISVYQYEDLQITIDLELGYAAEGMVTEEGLDQYDEDLRRFATVNLALAEDIRDRAIERRDNGA